jgi:hypothetical protein
MKKGRRQKIMKGETNRKVNDKKKVFL